MTWIAAGIHTFIGLSWLRPSLSRRGGSPARRALRGTSIFTAVVCKGDRPGNPGVKGRGGSVWGMPRSPPVCSPLSLLRKRLPCLREALLGTDIRSRHTGAEHSGFVSVFVLIRVSVPVRVWFGSGPHRCGLLVLGGLVYHFIWGPSRDLVHFPGSDAWSCWQLSKGSRVSWAGRGHM